MNSPDMLLILIGLACSGLLGLCCGFAIGYRFTAMPVSVETHDAELQRQLDAWNQWYTLHYPQCALLEESNAAGRLALAEWETAR